MRLRGNRSPAAGQLQPALEPVEYAVQAEAHFLVGAKGGAVRGGEREQRTAGARVETLRERPRGERAAEPVIAVRGRDADEGDPRAARPVEVELDEGAHLAVAARHHEAVAPVREAALDGRERARRQAAREVEVVDRDGVLGPRVHGLELRQRLDLRARGAAHQEVLAHGPEAERRQQREAGAVARAEAGCGEPDAELAAELERGAQQLPAEAAPALRLRDDRAEQPALARAREAQEAREAEDLAAH